MSACGPGTPLYAGPGIAGGTVRSVRCRRAGAAYLLEVEGAAPVLVAESGAEIVRSAAAESPPTDLDLEVLFGPGLVLALALRGVFVLHASCVRFGRRTVAFTGQSGSGKSTIGRLVRDVDGAERVSDDVLPVVASGEGVFALPRFPQLKLPPEEQWGADRPERIPLDAIYDLGCGASAPRSPAEPLILRLGPRDAVLRIAKRTVASRLFDASLTARQLRACSEIGERIPVRELSYERSLAAMPAVFDEVTADLSFRGER